MTIYKSMVLFYFFRQINFTNNHEKFSTVYKDKCKVFHVWTNKAGIKILIKVCRTQDTSVATMRSSSSHQWLSGHAPLTHESYSPSHTLVLLRLQHAQIYLGIFFCNSSKILLFHHISMELRLHFQNTNHSTVWKSCLCYVLKKVHISFIRCYAWHWRLMDGRVKENRE